MATPSDQRYQEEAIGPIALPGSPAMTLERAIELSEAQAKASRVQLPGPPNYVAVPMPNTIVATPAPSLAAPTTPKLTVEDIHRMIMQGQQPAPSQIQTAVQRIAVKKANIDREKEAMQRENGRIAGHDNYAVFWRIVNLSEPGMMGPPKLAVQEHFIPIGVSSDPNRMMTVPTSLYNTEADARVAITAMFRVQFRNNVETFLESLIRAGFESGVADDPEMTLASALRDYLTSISPVEGT
jgi:hypothetical protein